MPWWGWPFGPGTHAGSHLWQVLLASYGCSSEGARGEMSPMSSFQSQTTKSSLWEHRGHSSLGASPFGFSMPGTWERLGRKCSGHNRPFHQVRPGICNKDPNGSDNGKDPVGQVHCPLWSSQKNTNWPGMQFWESVGGWPLWVDGSAKDMDQSVSSADQWSMWKIQFHSDQYAWDITQGKEVRVEGSHQNIGPCIQLHSKFGHRVQPLLPHVW